MLSTKEARARAVLLCRGLTNDQRLLLIYAAIVLDADDVGRVTITEDEGIEAIGHEDFYADAAEELGPLLEVVWRSANVILTTPDHGEPTLSFTWPAETPEHGWDFDPEPAEA